MIAPAGVADDEAISIGGICTGGAGIIASLLSISFEYFWFAVTDLEI